MSASRQQVYEAVDTERDHQLARWGESGKMNPLSSWVEWMRGYLRAVEENPNQPMDDMRKVVALGVACMEQYGAPWRLR